MQIFDTTIKEILSERLEALENHFDADVVFYFGPIDPQVYNGKDFVPGSATWIRLRNCLRKRNQER